MAERDWPGSRIERSKHDPDLVAGTDGGNGNELSIWLNHFDNVSLFTRHPDGSRTAPPLLAIALAPLDSSATRTGRKDVIAGGFDRGDANLFVWLTRGTGDGEGLVPASPSRAYQTLDEGAVQALATLDANGDGNLDLVAGTRSPGGGHGTLELWVSRGGPEPEFDRLQVVSSGEGFATLGEVTAIEAFALEGGARGLVVGTRLSDGRGQIIVLGPDRAQAGDLVVLRVHDLDRGSVSAITSADYDGDGRTDFAVAVVTGRASGEIQIWRQTSSAESADLAPATTLAVPFIPTRLASANLGGTNHPDLVVGFRDAEEAEGGGVRIVSWEGGTPSAVTWDPSEGSVTGAVSGLAVADFDGAANAPFECRPDIAVATRTGPASGTIVLLMR